MAHRITGVMVFLFLLLHVVDVSLVNLSTRLYNDVHELYGNALLRLFEVGLLGGLVFHALNGLRIVTYDFFPGAMRHERRMLSGVVFLTTLAVLVGGWIIMYPFFFGRDF